MSWSVQAGHGKRAAEKIDLYLRGMEVKESEEERLEGMVEKIKVYNKNEKIGISGDRRGRIEHASSRFEKMDLR